MLSQEAKAKLEAEAKAAGCKWCERPEFQAAIAALRRRNGIYEIGRILHPEIESEGATREQLKAA
jgi:hypothetical protein